MSSGRDDLEDLTTRDLAAQLAKLSDLVARQQDELTALQERLAAFGPETPPAAMIAQDVAAMDEGQSFVTRRTVRRSLLKTAGASAAAIVGTSLLAARDVQFGTAPRAEAADGLSLLLGNAPATNTNNMASTRTTLTPVAGSTPDTLLYVDNSKSTAAASDATTLAGVVGIGAPGASGVIGAANGDTKNPALDAVSYGVWGLSNTGYAVVAQAQSGIDFFAAGPSGRILQRLTGGLGAPQQSDGNFLAGEQVRNKNGDLYICTTSGNPGTWKRVAAVQPGFAGGAINLLSSPVRLLDTRPGATTPFNPGAPLASGTPLTLQVAGTLVGGVGVPASAVGVIGNVTITNPTGPSDVRVYPAGGTVPLVSTINWAAGWTIANGLIAALGSNGGLTFQLDGANLTTDLIFDVSGFIQ